jgi:hypothetical protein
MTTSELADREAIKDLLAHYCFLVDSKQSHLLTKEIFTPDAIDDHGLGEWRGWQEIGRAFADLMPRFESTAHVLGNIRVELDRDRARSRSYVTAWHWLARTADRGRFRPADFVALGIYLDEMRKESEGWRISRRRFRPLGPSSLGIGELPPWLLPRQASES